VLHPESDNGADLNAVISNGAAAELKANAAVADKLPFILLSPQCPNGKTWDSAVMAGALNGLITELNKNIRIDKELVFVTGSGAGAKGAVLAAMDEPTRYRAVVPLSAIDTPASTAALYLKNTTLLLRAGEKDNEGAARSRKMADELKAAQANASFAVIPGVDANNTRTVFGKSEFYDELLKQGKPKPVAAVDVAKAPEKKDPAKAESAATAVPAPTASANVVTVRNPRELSQTIALVALTLSALFLLGSIYFLSGSLKKSAA
jgi:predicted peptidase